MVHTQSQHIFLALAAVALVAGPLGGTAAAVPGDDGAIDLAVDGSIRSQEARHVTTPVEVGGPVEHLSHDVAVRVRTEEVVLPNPAGRADEAAPTPLRVGPDGIAVDGTGYVVPWYYIMDDGSIRPYQLLFWDTGSAWYLGLADEVWSATLTHPSPTPLVRDVAPDVWLRTSVEEIDLAYRVDVLLAQTAASVDGVAYDRPAATDVGAAALRLRDEAIVRDAAGFAPLATEAVSARDAPSSEDRTLRSAQAAVPESIFNSGPLQAAALGAAGLLAAVAGYHLIRKSAILKNKVRSAIAEHVLRQPGSTITEIAQAVGVTHQTASYHLRLLQEHSLVLGVERGNKRLYFRNDGSFNNEERGLVAVLRDPESMRVLELIRQNPWIMKNEAAAALGVSRNTLNWHLQKLLGAGLVSEARENGHCFLFCNRRAAGEVMTQVVQKVEERRTGPAAVGMPPPPSAMASATLVPEHDRLGA